MFIVDFISDRFVTIHADEQARAELIEWKEKGWHRIRWYIPAFQATSTYTCCQSFVMCSR